MIKLKTHASWFGLFSLGFAIVTSCGGSTTTTNGAGGDAGASTDGSASADSGSFDAGLPTGACTFGADPSQSGVCADMACVQCQQLARCSAFNFSATYGSIGNCTQRFATQCQITLQPTHAVTPLPSYEACAKDTANIGCGDFLTRSLPPSCTPAPGDIPEGSACGTSAQCATSYCRMGDGGCGTCAIPSAGSTCPFTGFDCGPGLVCGTGGVCAPYAKLGEACTFDPDCVPTLACIGNKCVAPLPVGAHCDVTAAQDGCDELSGAHCDSNTSTCISAVLVTGQCEEQNGTFEQCGPGTYCSVNDSPPGNCTPLVPDNQSCASTNPEATAPTCLPYALCDSTSHTCVIQDPNLCVK